MKTDVPESVVENPQGGYFAAIYAAPPDWRTTDRGAVARFGQRLVLAWKMVRYRFSSYIFCHLWLLKLVFTVLRRVRPVFILGNVVVLTKMRDIREVLGRFDDFTLGEVIEPGMPWGPFLMTVDWREQHRRERSLLQSAVKRDVDPQTITRIVAGECRRRIAAANGRIDMVAALAEPVVLRIAADYFGVPPLRGDLSGAARATRNLAGIIMVNPPVGSQPWIYSRDDMIGLTQLILEQISATRSAIMTSRQNDLPDNLLTRLIVLLHAGGAPKWFDEDWIRRYLTGLFATGLATVVRGTAQTVDQLVARPDTLREAQKLAAALDHAEMDAQSIGDSASESDQTAAAARVKQARDALTHYIYEGLRFRPMLPLLVRDAPRATIIAKGTPRVRVVPAGARVLAAPLAAMFDPDAFPEPSRFNPARPIDNYIHFGYGERNCFGKYVAESALMEMVRALVRLPGLARASGRDGQIRYQGPAPFSFVLTFDQTSTGAGER
jgi:cytochrome P450